MTTIVRLARHRGVRFRTLERILMRYPRVALGQLPDGSAACQFMDVRPGAPDLRYLGPLLSTGGAFLPLFIHIMEDLLHQGRPFWAAAEIENDKVLDALTTLLPNFAFPNGANSHVPADALNAAHAIVDTFDHVHGFDPASFTTQIREAITPSPSGWQRYRLSVFGWNGSSRQARQIRTELIAGLRRLSLPSSLLGVSA